MTAAECTPMTTSCGEDGHDACKALVDILDRIGDKWTVMVVGALADGPMRFNAILRKIGAISHRMLTLTLRALERDGMVERRAFATIPPTVEYELTPLGRSLIEPLWAVAQWAQRKQTEIEVARAKFDGRTLSSCDKAKTAARKLSIQTGR